MQRTRLKIIDSFASGKGLSGLANDSIFAMKIITRNIAEN